MKYSIKKLTTVSALSTMLILAACSHENPSRSAPKEEAIIFIENASTYATEKMDYHTLDPKRTYNLCMWGHFAEKDPDFCPKFYDFMVDYADEQGGTFKNVTVKDLENKEFFESIKISYIKHADHGKF